MLLQSNLLAVLLVAGVACGWMLNRVAVAAPRALAHAWQIPVELIFCSSGPQSAVRQRIRALAVQLVAGVLAVMIAWRVGLSVRALSVAMFCGWITLLALIDLDTQLLPDLLTLPFMGCGFACAIAGVFVPVSAALVGAVTGWAILMAAHWAARLRGRSQDAIGQGDAKLLAAVGAWLGWNAVVDTLLVACLTCLLVVPVARWMKVMKAGSVFSFGPYLAVGGIVSILAWPYGVVDFGFRP
ncbi:A24 family peptidase (plasmid) [Burkholderia vietnamiensis]|uniref:Peptidase A24A, prepilin type IV n=1 Tax=Burkholderia vietnamiensis (strain G4 / LMG 22486) TaxID=269482 RepID=A4JVV8_BURVG|nr:peptidase A24A, prepilin type IV [Burkholderia vietnamiensis G4]MCB4349349.1 A24 family peptidase [Burkholderia vietnamiensis]